jgi:hypothetical protein
MTGPVIIASWSKNGREKLQVRPDLFKFQAVVDCRAWYADTDDTLKLGRGGLTVSAKHLPSLADPIGKALTTAIASGLIAGTDSQNA